MGREVRMVPPTWEHPRYTRKIVDQWVGKYGNDHLLGRYIPIYDQSYREYLNERIGRLHEAVEEIREFLADFPEEFDPEDEIDLSSYMYDHVEGMVSRIHFRPDWDDEERTHLQMYETTSEGTPISPPMPDPESLARWLADNEASRVGSQTATYEQWLSLCKQGWGPSAMIIRHEDGTGTLLNAAEMVHYNQQQQDKENG